MKTFALNVTLGLGAALLLASGQASRAQSTEPVKAEAPINAGPYVPTPTVIVAELLKMGDIKPTDTVLDLGSGDGRLVITAAKQYGARGWGIDYQEHLVRLANDNARKEGVADRVKFIGGDLFKADMRDATVVTLYLLPGTVTKLIPKFLAELKPGTRIVSHDYPLSPWQHERVAQFEFEEKVKISGTTRTVLYRYVVPAAVEGEWDVKFPPQVTRQPAKFTLKTDPTLRTRGNAVINGRSFGLDEIDVRAEQFGARLQELKPGAERIVLRATVQGAAMKGTADVDGKLLPFTATLKQ